MIRIEAVVARAVLMTLSDGSSATDEQPVPFTPTTASSGPTASISKAIPGRERSRRSLEPSRLRPGRNAGYRERGERQRAIGDDYRDGPKDVNGYIMVHTATGDEPNPLWQFDGNVDLLPTQDRAGL